MAKEEKLIPHRVANTVHTDLIQDNSIPEPKPGEYLLDSIGPDGKEQGKYFSVAPRTYERTYKNNQKFVVKKKPNK